ncbi:hypothetical protein Leryth_014662 [Lithospermum erythrorhizon]|nr:hypothetical protein Leryth_014662 [Lithospermum erythrorhizon]
MDGGAIASASASMRVNSSSMWRNSGNDVFSMLRKGLLFGSQGAFQEVDVDDLGYQERKLLLERLIKSEDDNEAFLLKLRDRLDRVCIVLPTIEVRYDHLSPPASGKTTLLLALAGRLEKELKKTGNVTYNGHSLGEFVPQRSAAYISQHDLHIGEMTVRETLEFSGLCQGVGTRYEMLADLARREKAANLKPDPDMDIFMKAAATRCKQVLFTDYILKDIRLGRELLVGPATALFMDEISTGLDSSTTFSIVNSLRQYVHILKGTAFVSLLQPAPETYNLFDDIVLISDGQIVYQGPREHVLEFFESMGFVCPERKGVADFLQEVRILGSFKERPESILGEGMNPIISSQRVNLRSISIIPCWAQTGDELLRHLTKVKKSSSSLNN